MGNNRFTFKVIKNENDKKRYRVQDVAYALRISQDAITSFFQNKGISTKGGFTLDMIEDAILHGNLGGRGGFVTIEIADEIVQRLCEEKGIILNENGEEQQRI